MQKRPYHATLKPLLLGATLALPLTLPVVLPAHAQDDLRGVIGGMAEAMLNQEMDRQTYQQARSQNTVTAYRNYLQRYPQGLHRREAEQALSRLGASENGWSDNGGQNGNNNWGNTRPDPNTSAAATEAALGLSRSQRIRVQQQLTSLGYNTGGSDGLWGRNTRAALSRWQEANRQTVSGYITARQIDMLNQQAGISAPSQPGTSNTADAQIEERLLGLTREERREVQQNLTRLGYNTRGSDGVFGRNSRTAIARWQGDQGERETGYITADQLRLLRSQSRG